jgi:hypothetical protein
MRYLVVIEEGPDSQVNSWLYLLADAEQRTHVERLLPL